MVNTRKGGGIDLPANPFNRRVLRQQQAEMDPPNPPPAGTDPVVTIGSGAKVGNDCIIYANSTIYHDCRVGNHCILHSGCVIASFQTIRMADYNILTIATRIIFHHSNFTRESGTNGIANIYFNINTLTLPFETK